MWLFEESVQEGVRDFVILSGDHLYRCNYQDFVREHRESGADITVAALPCDPARASAFGLMKIDGTGKITSFAEKPTGDALKAMEVDTTVLGLAADKAKVRMFDHRAASSARTRFRTSRCSCPRPQICIHTTCSCWRLQVLPGLVAAADVSISEWNFCFTARANMPVPSFE